MKNQALKRWGCAALAFSIGACLLFASASIKKETGELARERSVMTREENALSVISNANNLIESELASHGLDPIIQKDAKKWVLRFSQASANQILSLVRTIEQKKIARIYEVNLNFPTPGFASGSVGLLLP